MTIDFITKLPYNVDKGKQQLVLLFCCRITKQIVRRKVTKVMICNTVMSRTQCLQICSHPQCTCSGVPPQFAMINVWPDSVHLVQMGNLYLQSFTFSACCVR